MEEDQGWTKEGAKGERDLAAFDVSAGASCADMAFRG